MCTSSQWLFGMLLCVALAGCGSDLTLPDDTSPARLEAYAGDGQEGTVGSRLSEPLVVRLTDAAGRPVRDVAVTFSFEGSTDAEVESASEITDAEGQASAEVRLGTETGTLNVAARVVEAPGLKTRFSLTAVERDKGKKGRGNDGGDDDEDDEDDD